eukprot:1501780-Alexandrium_andersonii.AAC.1
MEFPVSGLLGPDGADDDQAPTGGRRGHSKVPARRGSSPSRGAPHRGSHGGSRPSPGLPRRAASPPTLQLRLPSLTRVRHLTAGAQHAA